ncbi:ImmA/IrrE family metallo-endopeptidase [Nocardioides limicola]|uniref:ImmA/IrrE family metallo-endopeptidase n=1 Tax=Nocardioides limicola TaxID=2803368 RepID=UPI00193B22D2|nr:ImmA/IrrE family metallo-endopeptidase [Nocardioides sp. DJM-14]
MREASMSLETAGDGIPTHFPEVEGHGGVQLSERNVVDHTESGPSQGTFTVWTADHTGACSNPTEHPYGPRAGFISSRQGDPVSKSTAARRAAEDVAERQQPRRCDRCGQYLPYDGSHTCPSSSRGVQLAQAGTSPVVGEVAGTMVEGLPACNYGDLKGDERVKAMVADLEESVKAVVESGRLGEWLGAMASNGMNRWSANNRILAMVQMSQRGVDINDLHLMGFRQWEKFNRKVSKGAKAVWILAPITRKVTEEDDDGKKTERSRVVGFKSVPVFNISDTTGDPLPENPGRPAPGEATQGTLEGLRNRVGTVGYTYEEVTIPDCQPETGEGTLGYTDPKTKKIVVDSRLSNAQKASTIAHELGHVHCGHVDVDYSEYRKHRGQMETEAEAVAFLTMRARGASDEQAHSFSPAYIAGWSRGDAKIMHSAIDKAVRAHNKIMDGDWPSK